MSWLPGLCRAVGVLVGLVVTAILALVAVRGCGAAGVRGCRGAQYHPSATP